MKKQKFLKSVFVFLLIFFWVFSGWPRIGSFPPKIQEARAAVAFHTYAVSTQSNGTTGFTMTIPATIATGEDLYILVSSRDHASGTALVTVTDNDTGGNTWTREGGSTNRKLNVYWKKATSGTASKTITVAGCVGSCTGGMSAFTGGFSGDPTTNFIVEDNISGNETHAGFTPDNADSFIVFGMTNPTNDTVVATLLNSANLGTLEPEQWQKGSTGGSDTYAIMTGIAQVGSAAATGNFTWAQTDSITNSVSFAIRPIVAPAVTTQAVNPVGDTTATCNGTITVTGGANATAVGCEWDTDSGAPYANNPSTAGDYGAAPFTQSLTGLPSGAIIYARAFATNLGETGYGGEVNFLTKPAAPTSVNATDGTYGDKVVITWTKSTGATDYHVWRDSTDLGSAGDVATFDDTGAGVPSITAGSSVASDGAFADKVALSLSGTAFNNGTSHTYKVVASNATGNSADSATNAGYRGILNPTYQWQRSSGNSDADYSNIDGATAASYDDTGAPANGDGRYYKCILNAASAIQQISAYNRGYRIAGTLSVLIVSGNGTEVSSPSVSFSNKTFDWSGQQSTGILGFSTPTVEKIRLNNTTGTPGWTLSISATSGSSALWSNGSETYDFNGDASAGRLEVDPSSGTITPQGGCSATGVNLQSSAYFDSGNSVDIIITSGSEDANCYWDITGVDLTQDIPASQDIGSYSINMTLTVT